MEAQRSEERAVPFPTDAQDPFQTADTRRNGGHNLWCYSWTPMARSLPGPPCKSQGGGLTPLSPAFLEWCRWAPLWQAAPLPSPPLEPELGASHGLLPPLLPRDKNQGTTQGFISFHRRARNTECLHCLSLVTLGRLLNCCIKSPSSFSCRRTTGSLWVGGERRVYFVASVASLLTLH